MVESVVFVNVLIHGDHQIVEHRYQESLWQHAYVVKELCYEDRITTESVVL
jgi:hypothetical protein